MNGRLGSVVILSTLLAGCTVGPDYIRPEMLAPSAFKESKGWKPGQPADELPKGTWWKIYQDPILDALEAQVEISNQSLKATEAAYLQAAALTRSAQASLWPTLAGTGGATRGGTSGKVKNSISVSSSASWDLDIWGKIRRTIEADEADAQASAADLASAKLSLQSTLAIDYFQLRVQDQLHRLLESAVEAYGQSLRITQNQYKAGVASRADVAQAETQLKTTQAQLVNSNVARAQYEHAIAVLIGRAPADFTLEPWERDDTFRLASNVPVVPVAIPASLLQRRPDIAAAERRVAAANADVGIATAAYYPDFSLSASFGFLSPSGDGFFKAANQVWSFGPAISQTLFDGGYREANLDRYNAAWSQTVATYRQTVLTAFQQVEDYLAALKSLEEEATIQVDAVKAAREAERLILNQYKAGTVAYTTVVTAQTAALSDEESALSVLANRLVASVSLVQALGGGWDDSQLPSDPAASH